MPGLFGTNAQVGQIKQTAIQPTGLPGSTFVRAPQREAGQNASALAQALSGLNNALQNFASVTASQENDPQSKANQEWIARRQQMGIDQLREEAKNGTADGVRVREDALNLMLGERANDDFRKHWIEFYNTEFDKTSGDAASEYERIRQEYAAGLPSEIAKGNFYRITKDHFSAWMEKDMEEKVNYAKQELSTTIVGSFRNSVDDAINLDGKSPEEAANIVFAKSAANRDFLGLSGQEQNDTIFALAQEYANQGNEKMARALLEGQRTGADGAKLPSLISIPAYSDKAYTLLDQASTKADQTFRKENLSAQMTDDDLVLRGAFTEEEAKKRMGKPGYSAASLSQMVASSKQSLAQIQNKAATAEQKRALRMESERQEDTVYAQAYNAMSRMGGVNSLKDVEIPNPSGEGTKKLSKQAIVDRVVAMREEDFNSMQEDLIAKGANPEDARQQVNRLRLDWYAGNKVVNEEWQNTLNGIAGRASVDTLMQKGEVSAYLKDSAKLYRDLKATNPAYLSTFMSDPKSKEFLETYDNAVSNRRMTEDDALLYSAQTVAQPEGAKARNMISMDKAETITSNVLSDLGVDERSSNMTYVVDRVGTMSRSGATEREIKDNLEKEIRSTAVPVNGMLVFDHKDLPEDFPALMEAEIQQRFTELGAKYGIEDPSDLYVVPDGTEGKWFVVSKSHGGMPIGTTPITPQSLESRRSTIRAEQEATVRKLAAAKDAERAELKRQYDEEIAAERAKIEWWKNQIPQRQKLSKTLAEGVYKRLQQNLDERLARDAFIIKHSPAERADMRNQKLKEQAQKNAKNLGFSADLMK